MWGGGRRDVGTRIGEMYKGRRRERGIGEMIKEILDEGGEGEEWMKRIEEMRGEGEGGKRGEREGRKEGGRN